MLFSENEWYRLKFLERSSVLTQTDAIATCDNVEVYFQFHKGVSCSTLEIGRMTWLMHHWEPWGVTSDGFCTQRWTQFQSGPSGSWVTAFVILLPGAALLEQLALCLIGAAMIPLSCTKHFILWRHLKWDNVIAVYSEIPMISVGIIFRWESCLIILHSTWIFNVKSHAKLFTVNNTVNKPRLWPYRQSY